MNHVRPTRAERERQLVDRIDRWFTRVIFVVLWLGTAYLLSHVLLLAGVGK